MTTEKFDGSIAVYAKVGIEIKAKPGVPHDKTLDIEKIMGIIENEPRLVDCYGHSFIGFDTRWDEFSPITKFSITVEYSNPCTFYKRSEDVSDEFLAIRKSDAEYHGRRLFETKELMIEITEVEPIGIEAL